MNIKLKDFTTTPGGRFRADGEFSAEEFRDEWVIPQLEKENIVVIELFGVSGLPPTFLEELFGGLVRSLGTDVVDRVFPAWNTPERYLTKIYQYMSEALYREVMREIEHSLYLEAMSEMVD